MKLESRTKGLFKIICSLVLVLAALIGLFKGLAYSNPARARGGSS